jgi:glycosyltransferase involved in cell wall biosynthesis
LAGSTEPLVDVLLPTHDRPRTVACAMRSVLGQSHRRLRLHVVGDGCSPATEQAVRSVEDPRVHFHPLPKARGYGYANRNAVLRATDAPFVAYVSDDDLWFPDHLARALAALEADGGRLALVAARPCAVRPPDLVDPWFFAFDWGGAGSALRHWFVGQASLVHRRSVLEAAGYWNEGLVRFGDREFYQRVRASALPTRFLEHTTVARFYALHWDRLYSRLEEPPQVRYAERLADPSWRARLDPAGRRPGLRVRARQCGDFLRFGFRSGPRFLRFAWERLRTSA